MASDLCALRVITLTIRLTQSAEVGYEKDLSAMLAKADCIALSLPLNTKTKGFFNKKMFSEMKDGSILVNTARGGVLDEDALIEALESGKVRWHIPL